MYNFNGMYPQYQPPIFQQPQPMMTSMTSGLNGKIITRLEDISANDVSMDGSNSIFPLADNSKIYVKHWNSNGTITTVEYRPIIDQNQTIDKMSEQPFKIDFEPITERLNSIESMLKAMERKTRKGDANEQ